MITEEKLQTRKKITQEDVYGDDNNENVLDMRLNIISTGLLDEDGILNSSANRTMEGLRHLFHALVERQTGKKLKCIRTDNRGEYIGPFDAYCRELRIQHQKTPLKTPQINGLAERMNRTLVGEVTAFVHIPKDERSKLDVKTKPCVFLGYGQDEFGYRTLESIAPIEARLSKSFFYDRLGPAKQIYWHSDFSVIRGGRSFIISQDQYIRRCYAGSTSIKLTWPDLAHAVGVVWSVPVQSWGRQFNGKSRLQSVWLSTTVAKSVMALATERAKIYCELTRFDHVVITPASEDRGRQTKLVGNETEIVPLYYHMFDNFQIQFGREEFCLVTGLKFGVEYWADYDDEDEPIPFRRRVFPSSLDANDRDGWDKYHWGSYVWPTLYYQLWDANVRRWPSLYVTEPTNEVDEKTYSIFGFTWAFKGRVPAETLIPDEIEDGSGWWVSSRAYFDGRVSEAE
ncbi:phospholipase-like protein [Tanacetum coccineum]|uniref:Phospholipase-like protein n=1 Tax=Tanacetum coccineum TaxID=301880 RepID=A0ABQ5APE8_9ASTR